MSTEDSCSEVRGLIPRILQALHAKKVWESVKGAEDVECSLFKDLSKPHIRILTPKNPEEQPVVVKFESKIPCGVKFFKIEPHTVEIHQLLSEHGLSTKLLAFSSGAPAGSGGDEDHSEPNFTVEALGVCYFDPAAAEGNPNYWDTANSASGTGGEMAKLAARLHKKVDPQWFDKYRSKIVELCPFMEDKGPDSPFWGIMRTDALGQARNMAATLKESEKTAGPESLDGSDTQIFLHQKRSYAPTNEDMKRIAALLPKPQGPHASRVVTVHSDLWAANVVKELCSNEARLIDLEGVTVSYAAIELAQFCNQRGVSKVYLEELTKGEDPPTEEEIDRFWLEALIAGNVQDVLRYLCWEDQKLEVDSVTGTIAHAERFHACAEKLRTDQDLCAQFLRNKGDDAFSEEAMTSVLGNSS